MKQQGPHVASPELPAVSAASRIPRVFEEICDQIRSQLRNGTLRPGDKLPAERELAAQLGTGRAAVREALRSLEMAGVIELRQGVKGGAFICEGDPKVVTRSMRDMVYLGHISLDSLTESRVIITDAVIRLACERATEADFAALEECIDRTWALGEGANSAERRVQLVEFYRLLSAATRNEIMAMLVDGLTDIVLGVLERVNVAPRPATMGMQRQLLAHLRARDVEAASDLMRRHLQSLHQHFFEAQARHASASSMRRREPMAAPDATTA